MRTYKRVKIEGGCYFFTLALTERQGNDLLIRHFDELREAFRRTQHDHPFKSGSRYFCESLFWASQPKQAAKT